MALVLIKPETDGVYKIKVADENRYLTLASNGTVSLQFQSDTRNAKQQWWIITLGPATNTYLIKNASDDSDLTYSLDGTLADAEDGYLVCRPGAGTTWFAEEGSSYSRISVYGLSSSDDAAGKVLDCCFPDNIVHFWPHSTTRKRQRWTFIPRRPKVESVVTSAVTFPPPSQRPLENGLYVIRSVTDLHYVVDVSEGNPNPGNPLIAWPAHYGDNQKWNVTRLPNGRHILASVLSDDADDVYMSYAKDTLERPVVVGRSPTEWKLSRFPGRQDIYSISTPGGLVMDLKEQAAPSSQNRWHGSDTQMWQFEETL